MRLVSMQTDKELSECLSELSKTIVQPVLLHDETEKEIPRPADYDER